MINSVLAGLRPTMVQGLLCVGRRIQNAPIPEGIRQPIILPQNSHVVDLLVRHVHESNAHSGREYVLSILRERFWIIGARSVIRRIIAKCVHCKKRDARPNKQEMADLPVDRVTPGDPPFTYVGVDYFGPFKVKRGRGTEKRYGCLFTCLVTRAIHIEVAHTMDTSSFINCLQRFIARRGQPRLIRSDNGTNFVGGERELREEIERWNKKQIQDQMNEKGIMWKFNTPLASHMGGVWERQIRTVRKVLAGISHQQLLSDEALSTLMCMAESMVNNRPITIVSSDPNDLEPLTPNHLLLLRKVNTLPGIFSEDDNYVRQKWRQVQYLADLFWRRWTREYLPSLQPRKKGDAVTRNVACGDIVIILDNNLPRNEWLLGKVTEVFAGQDGNVRSVKIKTKGPELIRPINKISVLEEVAIQGQSKEQSQGVSISEE